VSQTIYFSGSISGGRHDLEVYRAIVEAMTKVGHRVIAGAVTADHIGDAGELLTPGEIHARDLRWIDECDILVAEGSRPSLGVGYEVAYARYQRNIPIICLYRPAYTKRCSAMIGGDPAIRLIEYESLEEALPILLQSIRDTLR
jgi:2'-deoxynucleoside 5'-phosphate N-hydrolase